MRFILVKEKALFQVLFQNDNRYYKKYFMNNGLLTNIIPYFEKEKTIIAIVKITFFTLFKTLQKKNKGGRIHPNTSIKYSCVN